MEKGKELARKPVDMLKNMLSADSVKEQFKNALGEHKDAFVASLIDLYTGDTALQSCAPAEVIKEALRAATMKLPLNKALGFAYIIVFNNRKKQQDGSYVKVPTPTFVCGYKGFIQLAMRTGQYKTINADVVYDGELVSSDKLTGLIDLSGTKKSDKIIGYFCYFELLNGCKKVLYMSVEQMAQYALTYSPSFKGANKPSVESLVKAAQNNTPSQSVGWNGNFNDMALKTVIRRLLSKYGYLSIEMTDAITADVESGAKDNGNIEDAQAVEVVDMNEADFADVDDKQESEEGPGY